MNPTNVKQVTESTVQQTNAVTSFVTDNALPFALKMV
jgi:hypothetical protein